MDSTCSPFCCNSLQQHPSLPKICNRLYPTAFQYTAKTSAVCLPAIITRVSSLCATLQAVPYKPPHKAESLHAQYLQPFSCAAAAGRQATTCMRVSSAGSDSGSAAEAAAAAVPDGSSPGMPSGSSPHDQTLLGGSGPLTSWECRQQQAMQECTFSPRLNTNTKRSKSVVAQVWKHCPAAHANPTVSSAALQPETNAEAAAAVNREGATADSHSPVSSSSASSGPKHAAPKPQFVTAPMHHEAARARHRHLVSYAAPAAGAGAAAVSRQAAVLPDAGASDKGQGEQESQLQQADTNVGRALSADEAELQAALQECNRQQQLLQTRWRGKRGCGAGKQVSHCSAVGVR